MFTLFTATLTVTKLKNAAEKVIKVLTYLKLTLHILSRKNVLPLLHYAHIGSQLTYACMLVKWTFAHGLWLSETFPCIELTIGTIKLAITQARSRKHIFIF